MRSPGDRPDAVGDVLRDVLKRVDPNQQLRAYAIWSFWRDEVGEAIARRAHPTRFRNGVLFVTVATHSWMQELQFMKDAICDRLNARLEANLVRDIFFISGSEDVVAPAPAQQAAAGARSTADRPIALPPIADTELAHVFTRIIDARRRRVTQVDATAAPRRRTGHAGARKPRGRRSGAP